MAFFFFFFFLVLLVVVVDFVCLFVLQTNWKILHKLIMVWEFSTPTSGPRWYLEEQRHLKKQTQD